MDVLPSKDASKVSNWLTEGLDTAPEPRTKQFSLSVDDPDNPAWALSSIPHSALAKDGSEIMVLTLDNKSQQYVAKIATKSPQYCKQMLKFVAFCGNFVTPLHILSFPRQLSFIQKQT